MSTLKEALELGTAYLASQGIGEAQLDARYLLEDFLGMDRTYYYLHREEAISPRQEEGYKKLLKQRGQHVPLQHILGKAWFMGLEFAVNEHVLIPRQDTEILVEQVLPLAKPGVKVLDLCTGSGCILLSILHLSPDVLGTGTDLSKPALEVAEKNRERLGLQARFICSDLFQEIEESFDLIVSNPPYIPTGEIPFLMEEVRDYEPWMALDGEQDGLAFYRRIIREARNYLSTGGTLALEIGCGQGAAVRVLMGQQGYKEIRIIQDLAGLDRVVLGMKGE